MSVKCPQCGREPAGEATLPDGRKVPVYQCDTCTREVEFDGVMFEVAVTFVLDAGRPSKSPGS
jgi:hypothetical protein